MSNNLLDIILIKYLINSSESARQYTCVAFDESGKKAAIGSSKGSFRIFNTSDWSVLQTVKISSLAVKELQLQEIDGFAVSLQFSL